MIIPEEDLRDAGIWLIDWLVNCYNLPTCQQLFYA